MTWKLDGWTLEREWPLLAVSSPHVAVSSERHSTAHISSTGRIVVLVSCVETAVRDVSFDVIIPTRLRLGCESVVPRLQRVACRNAADKRERSLPDAGGLEIESAISVT